LGTLGGPDSAAIFVNNSGQIAGQSLTNSVVNPSTGQPTQHPFLWQKGKMLDLGTIGGTLGFPTGLNNRGQVIGLMTIAGDATYHGFLWDQGAMIDLGTLGGGRSLASWINDSGEVLGISNMPGDQSWHGFVWKNGVITDIGTLDSDPCSDPGVINARGQAVGFSTDCHGHVLHVFLWENVSIVNLQSLVSPPSDVTVNDNLSINDRGEIAAAGSLPNGDTHSLLLVPCDDDHPNIDGCDYSSVDESATTQAGSDRVMSRPTTDRNDNSPMGTAGRVPWWHGASLWGSSL
jgi:probable HAF family extracellular repeat protein